jgi:16S rRNA processing protein RimM
MAGGKHAPADGDVLLGVVLSAHGLKGEVKVKTFTDKPASLGAYGPLDAGDGRQFVIAALRPTKGDEALVQFKGISDRNGAESLKGQRLSVPRAALPEPEEDEFYLADLIGLGVEDSKGAALGTVKAIHNFGAGDVVEIEGPDGLAEFIPFSQEAVPVVDLKNKRIVVVLPRETDD